MRMNTSYHSEGEIVLVIHGICSISLLHCVTVVSTYFLLIVLGIILNILVCHVMVKRKRYLKSLSCLMITHLGVVEVVYRVVVTPPLVFLSMPSSDTPSSIPCKANYFFSCFFRGTIFGSLSVIAVDRYRSIVHPLSVLKQRRRSFTIVLLVWLCAATSSAMFLYTAQQVPVSQLPEGRIGDHEQIDGKTSCDIKPDYLGGISVTVSMLMTFVIPLMIIVISYCGIFISLKRRCQSKLVHKAAAKSKAKAAKMLVIVVSCFVVCWAPSVVMMTVRSYGGLDATPIDVLIGVSISVNVLALCSSLVNPIIYGFYSSGFKNDIINTCGCRLTSRLFQARIFHQVAHDNKIA